MPQQQGQGLDAAWAGSAEGRMHDVPQGVGLEGEWEAAAAGGRAAAMRVRVCMRVCACVRTYMSLSVVVVVVSSSLLFFFFKRHVIFFLALGVLFCFLI